MLLGQKVYHKVCYLIKSKSTSMLFNKDKSISVYKKYVNLQKYIKSILFDQKVYQKVCYLIKSKSTSMLFNKTKSECMLFSKKV